MCAIDYSYRPSVTAVGIGVRQAGCPDTHTRAWAGQEQDSCGERHGCWVRSEREREPGIVLYWSFFYYRSNEHGNDFVFYSAQCR